MSTLTQTQNAAPATGTPETCGATTTVSPRVDIVETLDRYILRADLPGVNKEGLEVLLENNELTLVGRRNAAPLEGTILHQEIRPVEYRRTFSLDPSIDTAKITARMDQGVLTLELPKAEAVKPRKIAVTN